jgi:hypothetical protein
LCVNEIGASSYRALTFFSGCGVFQITLSREYSGTSFKTDLKKLYNVIGVQGKPTVFLFTAVQILEEGKFLVLAESLQLS